MKIIDLLNKIANGEETPEKFRFAQMNFKKVNNEYIDEDGDYIWESMFTDYSNLNDEVEIIEEDKKIEKIRNLKTYYDEGIEEKCFYEDGNKPNNCIVGDAGTELLIRKINELIDEVNKLKEEK